MTYPKFKDNVSLLFTDERHDILSQQYFPFPQDERVKYVSVSIMWEKIEDPPLEHMV